MDLRIIYVILVACCLISIVLYCRFKNKIGRMLSGLGICICIIIGCLISIVPILSKTNYGLDLQGGFEVLYEVSPIKKNTKLDSDMVYNTYQSLVKRIDILGVSEPEITIEGDDKIRVKLAGIKNKEEAREVLASTASLTFRDSTDHLLMTSDVLGGNAKVTKDQKGRPAVSLSIKDTDTFYDVTSRISKKENNVIVIWLDYDEDSDSYSSEKENCGSLNDSHCLSAATVSEGFSSDVIISGNFTEKEATNLVELINSGALPTKLSEVSSRTVEASFGANSLNKTMTAGIVGICLVILLMVCIYHFAGFIASMGVIIYTALSFLIFYLINGVLTLPGIAAMLLGIGMAVDANVISFERIKDQLKIGKSLNEAFKIGNKSSFSSIIDANITTMIVAIIIFIFGESSVKGFATMLIISTIVTVLVMVYFIKFILYLFVKSGFFDDKPNLFVGVNKKKIHKSDKINVPFKKLEFVRNRKYFLTGTLIVIIVGLCLTLYRGANLGVDFTGGTSVTVNLNDKVKMKSLEDDMKKFGYTIKKKSETKSDITLIIDEVLNKNQIKKLSKSLEKEYKTNTNIYTVSKVVKQELVKNAIYSVLIALVGILVYVSFRFKFNYAVAAIVALFHDVTIIILFFCIFKLEISTIFIAAMLTIIGYSINDTIVTFDMIRENYIKMRDEKEMEFKKSKKDAKKKGSKKNLPVRVIEDEDLVDLVNNSVRITFFRSVLTTVTTIIPVICLMVMGAHEIVNFNIALFVGFIAGVYSSIYISNQLWLILETRSLHKPKKDKVDLDDGPEEIKIKGVNC